MGIDCDPQRLQAIFREVSEFLIGITDIQNFTAWCESRGELVNDLFDQDILPTCR